MINLNYQRKFDVLHVQLGDNTNSIAVDEYDDIVVFKDKNSREITGLEIFDFMRRYRAKQLPELPRDVKVDIETEVIPKIAALA
jgi:GH43 family beta-xylosidase